jgi:hypothetical protein
LGNGAAEHRLDESCIGEITWRGDPPSIPTASGDGDEQDPHETLASSHRSEASALAPMIGR